MFGYCSKLWVTHTENPDKVRFNIHRVPLVGDVEKAFLTVGVAQKDRDALQFSVV